MNFSPSDRKALIERAAELLVAEIKAEVGDLATLIVLPTSTVGHLVGLTARQIPKRLPITEIGPSSHGVTLRALQDHIISNTKEPAA